MRDGCNLRFSHQPCQSVRPHCAQGHQGFSVVADVVRHHAQRLTPRPRLLRAVCTPLPAPAPTRPRPDAIQLFPTRALSSPVLACGGFFGSQPARPRRQVFKPTHKDEVGFDQRQGAKRTRQLHCGRFPASTGRGCSTLLRARQAWRDRKQVRRAAPPGARPWRRSGPPFSDAARPAGQKDARRRPERRTGVRRRHAGATETFSSSRLFSGGPDGQGDTHPARPPTESAARRRSDGRRARRALDLLC